MCAETLWSRSIAQVVEKQIRRLRGNARRRRNDGRVDAAPDCVEVIGERLSSPRFRIRCVASNQTRARPRKRSTSRKYALGFAMEHRPIVRSPLASPNRGA
jgi:hypothetical protein